MTKIDARMISGQGYPGRVDQRSGAPAGAADPSRRAARPAADRVTLSDEARALAAAEAEMSEVDAGTLSPERVAEIRAKIQQGAYDATDVVDQVARRLLDSGTV